MFTSLRSVVTHPTVVVSVITGMLLVGVQRLGVLEPIELKAFDQMMQRRGDLGSDNRLLIVGFTEDDIQKLKQSSPNGKVLDSVLSKLERYQAKVIGLDFFRDVPVQPGHQKLLAHLKKSSRIIPICKLGEDKIRSVPPPAGISPENAGFADIPEDKDGVIRRNLLVVTPNQTSACSTPASFGLQLAIEYLNIQPQFTKQGYLQLGKKVFKPLQADSGGYHNIDAKGFQILLNYRSQSKVAQQVSMTDVLSDRIKPTWVKNRIVLIGSTAPSSQDIRYTPYSDGKQDNSGKMSGVIIHAQMLSQILDAVSGKRPLFWFFPEWGIILWIWGWSVVGAILPWRFQRPLALGLLTFAALGTLVLSYFIIFMQAGWIPLAYPILGFLLASGGVFAYTAFQNKQQKDKITLQIQEQNETISLLQALLKEGGSHSTQIPTVPINDSSGVGQLLKNRYKITDVLGCGGFSYTYLAIDTHRPGNPTCVVKHLQPARSDDAFLEIARRLFKTEAEILELLGYHNQIPQLMAYFEEHQQFYLVQEYICGNSLQTEITSANCFSETQVIDFLKEILQILMFVHGHGIIHRDIKPSNLIRRQKDKRIVLIDFGAVKQIQPQQQENPTVAVGTMGYASPEQFMGHPRFNSDIYAVGMIAIQALTGRPTTSLERDATMTVVWRDLAKTSEELARILDQMVAFDSHKRYQSVDEVLHSLSKLS